MSCSIPAALGVDACPLQSPEKQYTCGFSSSTNELMLLQVRNLVASIENEVFRFFFCTVEEVLKYIYILFKNMYKNA